MNLLGRNKPLSHAAQAEATALLLEGMEIRKVAKRMGCGLGTVSRLRTKLVDLGELTGRGERRLNVAPRHNGPRNPASVAQKHPAVREGSFISVIPLSRLMAGR